MIVHREGWRQRQKDKVGKTGKLRGGQEVMLLVCASAQPNAVKEALKSSLSMTAFISHNPRQPVLHWSLPPEWAETPGMIGQQPCSSGSLRSAAIFLEGQKCTAQMRRQNKRTSRKPWRWWGLHISPRLLHAAATGTVCKMGVEPLLQGPLKGEVAARQGGPPALF